jgi:membrane-associated protease RseP (regulator of RpoE activity)
MKKIKLLSILVLSGAVLFGAKATTVQKAKVNFKESADLARSESAGLIANLVIDAKEPIHGAQFDIKYNTSEVKTIIPQTISGFEVSYNELSDGLIRGLIFSFQGHALPENLPFEFVNVEGFEGTSTIEFKDFILAGSQGNNVEVETQSYDVNFSNNAMLPVKTGLSGSYPNPFNPTTSINYGLETAGHVEIMIYDAAGRLVEELVNGHQEGGKEYSITWNASNQASGMYFAKMVAGEVVQTQKLVLLK